MVLGNASSFWPVCPVPEDCLAHCLNRPTHGNVSKPVRNTRGPDVISGKTVACTHIRNTHCTIQPIEKMKDSISILKRQTLELKFEPLWHQSPGPSDSFRCKIFHWQIPPGARLFGDGGHWAWPTGWGSLGRGSFRWLRGAWRCYSASSRWNVTTEQRIRLLSFIGAGL